MPVKYTPAAMASTFTTADVSGVRRAPVSSARWHQRLFFTGMPIAMVVAVFVGFAPTYYLKAAYGTPALSPLYHFHGLLFSLWMGLLVTQPALVAARRINLHRRLGTVGGMLAAAMTATALAVAIDLGRRGAAPPGVPPLSFLAVPLATVIVFPALDRRGASLAASAGDAQAAHADRHVGTGAGGHRPLAGTGGCWPARVFRSHRPVPGRDAAVRLRDPRSPASGHNLGRAVPDRVSGAATRHQRTGPWLAFAGWLVG